jgi:hypothetical protein
MSQLRQICPSCGRSSRHNRMPRIARARLFEYLKHGDEKHQAWLREAIEAFFDHKPRPEPR